MTGSLSQTRGRPEPEIRIDSLGGLCPVQADGMIDGVPFYFRSRGDAWSIEIGPGNTHLVVAAMERDGSYIDNVEADSVRARPVWTYEEGYGTWPEAGYVSEKEARAFIAKGAALWRAISLAALSPADDGGAR